jgi:putative Holliday junction resolvase
LPIAKFQLPIDHPGALSTDNRHLAIGNRKSRLSTLSVQVTNKLPTCMNPVLGIDTGDARIGLAISDDLGFMAHPLETVKAGDDAPARITAIVKERNVKTIVVGMPRNMDGTRGPAAEKAKAFAEKVREATGCDIRMWDERLTTTAAQKALHEAGRNVKNSRSVIDQVAAQMILQGWLDAQAFSGGM